MEMSEEEKEEFTDWLIDREECIEYNNGNDIKVGSIEEAMQIMNKIVAFYKDLDTLNGKKNECKEIQAIKIVLGNLEALCDMQRTADREIERQKQINKELKQKIVDKIQERKFELQQEYKDFEDDKILQILEELLQEE